MSDAFADLLAALERSPDDDDTAAAITRIAADTSRWADLVTAANSWLLTETEPGRKVWIALRLARWYAVDLSRADYAQPYFQLILSIDPQSTRVLRVVAESFLRQGRNEEAVMALSAALDKVGTEAERNAIRAEIAALRGPTTTPG